MFFSEQSPLAVLLYGEGCRNKAVPGKSVLPVIDPQNSLEIGQGDKGMQYRSVHANRVSPA
jgi:hypothetical protein